MRECPRTADLPACPCVCRPVCPPACFATTPLGRQSAAAAKLKPAGSVGGNGPAEGLNYFAPRETGPRPRSAVDLGGKGPKWSLRAGWSRGCRTSAVGAATCLKYTSKAAAARAAVPEKVSSVARWGRPKGHAPLGPGWRPSPAHSSRGLAASPKDAECWPGCNNEGTSQALLQGPEGLREFSGPPGSVENFEIHTVCPLMCECLQCAGPAGPPLPQVGAPGCGRSAPTKASSVPTRKEKRAAERRRPRL